jgi:hypothetical protein
MLSWFDFFKLGALKFSAAGLFIHILFIIALCGIYTFKYRYMVFRFILIFLTGYLLTFFIAAMDFIQISESVLNFLLPLTVLITSILNFFIKRHAFRNKYPSQNYRYYLSFVCGNIHGLALPVDLKPLLTGIHQFSQMFSFNLGVVTVLVLLVFMLLTISFIITYFIRVNIREWNLLISGACAGISLHMITNYIV